MVRGEKIQFIDRGSQILFEANQQHIKRARYFTISNLIQNQICNES